MRRPIVGVMGSGECEHAGTAEPLGRFLAGEGVHLLTGGGRGVMAAVARAFLAVQPRAGLSIGVLPSHPDDPARPREGYPNPFVELPIRTHLPRSGTEGESERSRNHVNVLTADAVLVLPGGAGTASEVRLALRYGRPIAAVQWSDDDAPTVAALPVLKSAEELRAFLRDALGEPAG
jgi:uncharacterized protein (TIGR00725 family)